MKSLISRFFIFLLLAASLTSCGAKNNSDDSDGTGGGYLSCVLELTELKRQGVLEATSQEIQEECSSSYLP